jgi:hypothetical protein
MKRPNLEALDLKDWDEWSDVERDEFTAYARELDRLLPCLLIRCQERGCGRYATRRHPTAVIGDTICRCDDHPGPEESEHGYRQNDLPQAEFVRAVDPRPPFPSGRQD